MAHRVSPMYRNFLAGEIDPRYDGLIEGDIQAMRTAENVLVRKLGGVTRRPGTIYAGAAHATGETTRLIPFTNAAGTSYVLELCDYNMNVWKQSTHASVATAVTTPWAQAEVFGLKYVAIGNKLYVTNSTHGPYVITWVADATWTVLKHEAYTKVRYIVTMDNGYVASSTDGLSWQQKEVPVSTRTLDPKASVFAEGISVLVDSGATQVLRSSDGGDTWSNTTLSTSIGSVNRGAYGNGYFVVGGYKSPATSDGCGRVLYSNDAAVTWTTASVASVRTVNDLCYADTLGLWLVCGNVSSDAKPVATSPDLAVWTGRALTSVTFSGICWNGSTAVTVGANGALYSSTNGTSWTSRTSGTAEDLLSVIWTGDLFLAFGDNGAVIESRNGTSWIVRAAVTAAGNGFYDAAFLDGKIIAATQLGIITSLDYGSTWLGPDAITISSNVQIGRGAETQFQGTTNFPRAIGFHEQRLLYAGTSAKPDTIYGSKIGSVVDFSDGYLATDGLVFQLAAPRNMTIYWMESVEGGIVIGAQNGIGFLQGGEEEGLTPLSRKFRWVYPHGSADVQGIRVGNSVFYATRGGEIIRAFPSDTDHTALAEHIASGGITQFDYADDPFPVLYAVRADGVLLCGTVHGDSISWTRWVTRAGDEIESIAVVPNATSNEDELWMCVKRVIGGATKRFIEYAKPLYLAEKQDAHFVDSGVFYASTTASHITGLTHLASQSVACLIGGTVVETHTVTAGGSITITRVGSQVHAGLAFTSKLQTCRLGMGYGPITNHIFANVHLWLYQTIGGKVGPTTLSTESRVYTSTTSWTTDMEKVAVPGTWDDDSYLWVIQSDPLPMTVMAMSGAVLAGEI